MLVSLLMLNCDDLHAGMIDKDGMAPWEICGLCHGADGISVMDKFPKLAGQKARYLKQQFMAFKQALRSNDGGQMQSIVTEVEADDIDAIVLYFSELPTPGRRLPEALDDQQIQLYRQGEEIYQNGRQGLAACSHCHANNASSAPRLMGQHGAYLRKQLLDFKHNKRKGVDAGLMQSVAKEIADSELDAVIYFLEYEVSHRR